MKQALVVGGSSGLGLAVAQKLTKEYSVTITGTGMRQRPSGFEFRQIDLTNGPELAPNIKQLVASMPQIDLLVYAAGKICLGTISDMDDGDIGDMTLLGLVAPALLFREALKSQGRLESAIVVTSTAESTPRVKEPIYNSTKAALSMLANSLSLDVRIGHMLVVAPGGMNTPFWDKMDVDSSEYLDPTHVANLLVAELDGKYEFKHIQIPRKTGQVDLVEHR